MTILIIALAITLWATVYWPVYLIMKIFFAGTNRSELKANTIALFWPITVPLGLVFLAVIGKWR